MVTGVQTCALPIWRDKEIVGSTHGQDMFQVVVDPGKHVFHAKHLNVSVIKAELEAGKSYDIVVDCGPNFVPFQPGYRLWLNVIDANSERRGQVLSWVAKAQILVLSEKQKADREAMQAKQAESVQKYLTDFVGGEKDSKSAHLTPADGR
jgi:hypothetical protein